MLSGVVLQIDQLRRGFDRLEGCFLNRQRRTGKRQHRAVVVEVGRAVEELDVVHGLNGCDDLVDDFRPPRFGKVGDTFDELGRHMFENWRLEIGGFNW